MSCSYPVCASPPARTDDPLDEACEETISVRGITFAWIEEAVSSLDFVEADPRYRSARIAELGGRVLRVEHRPEMVGLVNVKTDYRARATTVRYEPRDLSGRAGSRKGRLQAPPLF